MIFMQKVEKINSSQMDLSFNDNLTPRILTTCTEPLGGVSNVTATFGKVKPMIGRRKIRGEFFS